jgi:hypothetical protein
MRAATEREVRRKGIVSEKPTDPTDLTGASKPAAIHRAEREDPMPTADVTGSDERPDPATREEHQRQ